MHTHTPLARLALVAALCCAGLAQAQVAGSSTQLGASSTEKIQRAMGWGVGKPVRNATGKDSRKAEGRFSQLRQAGARQWQAFAGEVSAATLRLRKSLQSATH
jgi:hypothetical protein